MKKIINLAHVTLTPNLLFGAADALAPNGRIHAQAISSIEHEGKEYASAGSEEKPDVYVHTPDMAQAARDLFQQIAQHIADEAGCTVRYLVNGEPREVQPQPK